MKIPSYNIESQIYESSKVKVFNGTNENNEDVILKVLNKDYPTPEEISVLQKEYNILQKIQSSNIIKAIKLENFQQKYILVLEDVKGTSLDKFLAGDPLGIKDFFDLAIPIVTGLRDIHYKNIIHKDIKPHNVIYNEKTNTLKLIDFDSATVLSRENPSYIAKILEGTMHYISPEQTGRMNRTIDYRTDFYSLGILFFEMLTGKLPFTGSDAAEFIHNHIALKPPHPSSIKSDIPEVLSEIVLKLLEKLPEQRYQDASGILYDLNHCKEQLKTKGNIEYFTICQKDFSKKFQIPEKIYGREKEIEILLEEYRQVTSKLKKVGFTCVFGPSGIGKTALIQELHKPVVKSKAFFASGKFDQLNVDTPYNAFLQAFTDIIKQILTEPAYSIEIWKRKFLTALGENGQIIIDSIPELQAIIGKQKSVAELPPQESSNRYTLMFTNFMKAIAAKDNPVVIFLDDMQWADSGSVKLLEEYLSNYELSYLYLICAYRIGELNPTHPFQILLNRLDSENFTYSSLELKPFPEKIITEVLSDTLKVNPAVCANLSDIVYQKTGGNPFFIYSYLKSLHKDQLINPKIDEIGWTWDIDSIKKTGITENVVELLSRKLKEYKKETLQLLQTIASMGVSIETEVLIHLSEKTSIDINYLLEEAVEDGMVLISENEIKLSHDKIRESVYSLLDEKEKSILHYKIGKNLLSLFPHEEEKIFDITDQLNLGFSEIQTKEEKLSLIQLNLKSAVRAKSASAFQTSQRFFKKAEEILLNIETDPWKNSYSLSSELFTGLAQIEYLNKNYETAENLFQLVLEKSMTPLEKAKIILIQIALYSSLNKYNEAISMGLNVLKDLGVEIPEQIPEDYLGGLFGKVMQLIGTRKISELVGHSLLQEEEKKAAIKILALCTPAAYMAQPALLPILVLKIVETSLEHGNDSLSAYGFCLLGMITGSGMGNYNLGDEFGSLALSLINNLQIKDAKCNTLFIYASMIVQWKKHARDALEHFIEGVQAGINEGDLQFASYNLIHHNYRLFFVRENLHSALDIIQKYKPVILDLKQRDSTLNYFMWWQTLENLTRNKISTELSNDFFHEIESLDEWKASNNSSSLFYYYTGKIMTNYLFGNYNTAYDFCKLAEPHVSGAFGMMHVPEMKFWESITILKLLTKEGNNQNLHDKIKENIEYFKNLMEHCEANFSHKFYILEGEYARISGDLTKSLESLSLAIELSAKHNYIIEEAISHEFAIEHWIQKRNTRYASYHLEMALKCYGQWGCSLRVSLLKNYFPNLLSGFSIKKLQRYETEKSPETTVFQTSPFQTSQSTDIQTILKSMKILASEIDLHKLLQKLMQILSENAGAERGLLLLYESTQSDERNLLIQSEFHISQKKEAILQGIPLDKFDTIPLSLIHYVERTWEDTVLDYAVNDKKFGKDAYIQSSQLKSAICIPVVLKGELIGILYLENNLSVGAFTMDRIQTLNTLVGQAAISIENARLYTNLSSLNNHLQNLNSTYEKFVPKQLLEFLEKETVLDIKLGDAVQKEMTILFSDIRSFTSLSEKMSPKENFEFLNSYLQRIGPVIRLHGGFIDKYIGDAIMALFPENTEGAIKAAIDMQKAVNLYNQHRILKGYEPLKIGIGIHTGSCMLGTIGEHERMDGTVISDAVNLASRLESITKQYDSQIIVSESVLEKLSDKDFIKTRILGNAKIRGKEKKVLVYEVLDGLPEKEYMQIQKTKESFDKAIQSFLDENYDRASFYFQVVLSQNPKDKPVAFLLNESEKLSRFGEASSVGL